jgi:hypothetical protein
VLVDLVIRDVDAKLREGHIALAYELCNAALESGATSASLFAKRGQIHRLMFQNGRAIEDLSTAVRTAPSVNSMNRLVQAWEIVVSLAQALREAGEVLSAIHLLETHLPQSPEVSKLFVVMNGTFELGYLRRQIWQSDRSWRCLRRLSFSGLSFFDAEIESTRREISDLRVQISARLKKIKNNGETAADLKMLAELLCKYGKPKFAQACLRRMGVGFESDVRTLIVKFYVLLRLQNVGEAVAELLKYRDMHDANGEYVYCLSFGLLQLGQIDAAVERLSALPLKTLQGRCFELLWRIQINKRGAAAAVVDWASQSFAKQASAASASQYLTALHLSGALRVEFGNIIGPENRDVTRPKTIVQFWDRDPPEEIVELMAHWRQSNPDWTYRLFDDESARAFIRANFGESLGELYDFCHHPAMKSDFFRVGYLLVHGGVYLDADEKCVQSADVFFKGWENVSFAASVSPDVPFYVHNWFISANPRHEILSIAWDLMTEGISQHRRERRKVDIWLTTGPGMLTRAVAQHLQRCASSETSAEIVLIPEHRFRQFAVTPALNYKATKAGNWRLA